MAAATPKVQRDEAGKVRREARPDATGRSEPASAADAASERFDLQEWRVSAMKAAIVSLDRGEAIPHAAVRDWIEFLAHGRRA